MFVFKKMIQAKADSGYASRWLWVADDDLKKGGNNCR